VSSFRRDLPRPRVLRALINRDFSVSRSYRVSFLLEIVYGSAEVLLFFFISRTFKDVTIANLHGAPSYFAFAAVGIAVTVVLQATTTYLASNIRNEQLTGTLEALVVQPVNGAELALGLAGYAFIEATIKAAFYITVPVVLLGVNIGHASWAGFVAMLIATGAAMTCIGILLGAAAIVFKSTSVLAGVVTLGLGLISGALYPISVLPGWVAAIGRVMPTRFAYDGLRAALYTGGGWAQSAAILASIAVVSLPVAIWCFERALDISRRVGSLGQY
jgi:ABC-2 type transport system permease protein